MRLYRYLAMALLSACSLLAGGRVDPVAAKAPRYDFSIRPFQGGNTDWSIRLVRVAPGQVVYTLHFPRRASASDGLLRSVEPSIDEPPLKGRYGLASDDGISPAMKVMIAPSATGTPCQDNEGTRYPHAVLVFIDGHPLYGCGDYDD